MLLLIFLFLLFVCAFNDVFKLFHFIILIVDILNLVKHGLELFVFLIFNCICICTLISLNIVKKSFKFFVLIILFVCIISVKDVFEFFFLILSLCPCNDIFKFFYFTILIFSILNLVKHGL